MPVRVVLRIIGILLSIAMALTPAEPVGQKDKLTRKELKGPIASAKTPADHERIAAYYRAQAEQLEAKHRDTNGILPNTTRTRLDTRASIRPWAITAAAWQAITDGR